MHRIELKLLRSLRDAPSEGMPWSRVPSTCQDLLARLCACGAVKVVPGRQGKRVCIANAQAFSLVVSTSSPQGLAALDTVPTRRGVSA